MSGEYSTFFHGRIAVDTLTAKGYATQIKKVSAPAGISFNDPSREWFVTVRPRLGTSFKFAKFEPVRSTWVVWTVKYVGPSKVKIGSKMYYCYLITRSGSEGTGELWIDSHGDLVKDIIGKYTYERKG